MIKYYIINFTIKSLLLTYDFLRKLSLSAVLCSCAYFLAFALRPIISKEQIKFWICQFRLIGKNDDTQRQRLIDTFVNSVYVYDDKLLITYNYKDEDKCIDYNEIQEYLNKKENSDNHKDYQSSPLNCFGKNL